MNAVNVIFSSLSYFVVKSVFVDGIRVFARKWQSPCDDVAEAATLCLCRIQPPLNPEFHIWFCFYGLKGSSIAVLGIPIPNTYLLNNKTTYRAGPDPLQDVRVNNPYAFRLRVTTPLSCGSR